MKLLVCLGIYNNISYFEVGFGITFISAGPTGDPFGDIVMVKEVSLVTSVCA